MADSRRMVVTGAGRGLGLEFARQWLEAGHEVFALARRPESSEGLAALAAAHAGRLFKAACDVSDDGSVRSARDEVAAKWDRLDLLLNNAGATVRGGESLESLDLDTFRGVMEVNAIGPLSVSRAFLPLLRKGREPRLVNLTSLMGSIADNRSGGAWSYRASKAALNMITRNLGHALRGDGIRCVVVHPGWVKTAMGGTHAPLEIRDAVAAMIRTIDALGPDPSDCMIDRNGEPLPW